MIQEALAQARASQQAFAKAKKVVPRQEKAQARTSDAETVTTKQPQEELAGNVSDTPSKEIAPRTECIVTTKVIAKSEPRPWEEPKIRAAQERGKEDEASTRGGKSATIEARERKEAETRAMAEAVAMADEHITAAKVRCVERGYLSCTNTCNISPWINYCSNRRV